MSDWQLLRIYAREKSETAFTQLVSKHMNLVYRTCLRDLGNAQLAEDATQTVFLLLARKAGTLGSNVSVAGWLFMTSRFVSRNLARGERRRRCLEEGAFQRMRPYPAPEENPSEVERWLNEALEMLTHREREVVLMRFFDGLSYQEIAREIGIAEDTAGKRARYAVEKMRRYLLKKKVAATSAALVVLLTSQQDNAAPPSCHAATLHAIHHITIDRTASMSSHFTLLSKGASLAMKASKYKYLLASALSLLLVGGIAIPFAMHLHQSKAQAAEIGCVTLTDAEAGPGRANDPASAARAEIERDIAAETNDQEHNQWKTEPWDAPGRVIIEGDHSRHPSDSILYATMNRFGKKLDYFAKDRTATIQVITFQLNGDHANVTSQFTERFVEKVQDPHFNDNRPVGSVFTGGGIEQSVWQKVDGRWMDVGPDSIPGTVHD